MNVFSYLKLIDRLKAFEIANISDTIKFQTIINFLDKTYGVKHKFIPVYNEEDEDNRERENTQPLSIQQQLKIVVKLLPNKPVIAAFPDHVAVFNKDRMIDPQEEIDIPIRSKEMENFLTKNNYTNIKIIDGPPPIRFTPDYDWLKKRIQFETVKERIKKNPSYVKYARNEIKHRSLKPGKYKIINKTTLEEGPLIFLRNGIDKSNNDSKYFKISKSKSRIRSFEKSKSKSKKFRSL